MGGQHAAQVQQYLPERLLEGGQRPGEQRPAAHHARRVLVPGGQGMGGAVGGVVGGFGRRLVGGEGGATGRASSAPPHNMPIGWSSLRVGVSAVKLRLYGGGRGASPPTTTPANRQPPVHQPPGATHSRAAFCTTMTMSFSALAL